MGLFKRSRDGPKERRDRSEKMKDFIRGVDVDYIGNSNSGVRVDELRAMQTSAVYACVKILSETVASLPLHLYKKEKEGKHELADQHPLNACLYELPNEEMTSFEFRESMMSSLLLWGNAYARIIRRQGHVVELWYLKPHLMTVERPDRAVYWNTRASSKTPKNSASHGTRSIRGHGTAIRSPFSKRA